MSKNLIAILIITLASISLSIPLTKPGLFQIHDDQQIARLFVFDQALKAGQFPVRWVDELGFGFGYPLFVFYPPLVYILGEMFHLIGFGFIDSVKLVFFSSIFLSGIAIYIFLRELWGKFPALVSALFYLVVPYRALDIYVRGALAESFSFVWLPLILWSFYKLYNTQKAVYFYLSGIFLALLMITHNLIFLPFMLILPGYLFFLWHKSQKKKDFFFRVLFSGFLAAGLSAFFWLPALLEKKSTLVDQLLLVNLANYQIHFVYPQQLWNWTWGFGGSATGLADGISFKIGKLHIAVSVAAFLLLIIHSIKRKSKSTLPVTSYQLPATFFLLFVFSAFMTTFYSKFIWDLIPPLGYLQFPWRFLTFTALFTSFLAGALIYLLRITVLRLVVGIILVILLLAPNLKLFSPQSYRLDLTDEVATSDESIKWYVSSSSFEYLPKGIETYTSDLGTNVVNINRKNIPEKKIEVVEGNAVINDVFAKPNNVSFSINAEQDSKLRANIFNFPGWQVKINDQQAKINDDNRLKLITFDVPKGLSEVEIEFKNTLVRTLANLATITLIIILVTIVVSHVRIRSGKLELRR